MLIVLLGASRGLYNATQRNNGVEQSSYASVWGGWTGKAHKGYKEGRLIRLKDADLEPVMKDGGPHIERADATMSVDTARVSTQKEYITGGIYGAGPNAEVQDRVKTARWWCSRPTRLACCSATRRRPWASVSTVWVCRGWSWAFTRTSGAAPHTLRSTR